MQVFNRHEQFWLSRARRLACFVNTVAWLERLVPVAIALNVLVCCVVLYLRGRDLSIDWVLWCGLAGLCVAALVIGILVWWRRIPLFAVLLRIETALQLNNQLTTAHEGHVSWPPPQMVAPHLYLVAWRRPLLAVLFSCLLLPLALIVPIGFAAPSPLAENASPPLALAEVASWVEQLSAEELVEEQALEALSEAVSDLQNRPTEDWYTAGALEAAENLHEHAANALSVLAHELQTTSSLLQGLQHLPDSILPSQMSQLEEIYKEALQGLESGALPLSAEMMQQMKQVDFKQLASLSSEQIRDLQSRCELMAQAAQGMLNMSDEERERLQQYYDSLKECEGGQGERQQTAPGGIQRGRGDAEMSYSNYRSPDEAALTEAVSNQDLRRAAIADTIRTTMSNSQESGDAFTGPSEGGGVESHGSGGDTVWIDRLTPAERKVLQEHFK